jgi:hypothetical protein
MFHSLGFIGKKKFIFSQKVNYLPIKWNMLTAVIYITFLAVSKYSKHLSATTKDQRRCASTPLVCFLFFPACHVISRSFLRPAATITKAVCNPLIDPLMHSGVTSRAGGLSKDKQAYRGADSASTALSDYTLHIANYQTDAGFKPRTTAFRKFVCMSG